LLALTLPHCVSLYLDHAAVDVVGLSVCPLTRQPRAVVKRFGSCVVQLCHRRRCLQLLVAPPTPLKQFGRKDGSKCKGPELATALLTRARFVAKSALQSQKWQLICMS